jgi:hypothetical protein
MALYSTNVSEAKKVSREKTTKEPAPKEPAPKKERSEKQIAAFEKAKETRKRKRDEAELLSKLAAKEEAERLSREETEKEAKVKAVEDAALAASKQAKKEAAKQKRLQKQLATPPDSTESTSPTQEVKLTEPSEAKEEPPSWFKKYISGVKLEENHHATPPVAKKVVKQNAEIEATNQWSQGVVRDRVNNEVNQHLHRLYSQIFSGR